MKNPNSGSVREHGERPLLGFLAENVMDPNSLVIIGLGNPDRSDDGFGIELVSRLKTNFPEQVFSETDRSVEGIVFNLLDRKGVETILFIDIADFGVEPGMMKIFGAEDVNKFIQPMTTHKVPISILMNLLLEKGKKPYLLGVQPDSLEFMGEMSLLIQGLLDPVVKLLKEYLAGQLN